MKKTVLANDGVIGLSIAGETDKFKIIANIMMMADRLGRDRPGKLSESAVARSLKGFGLEPTEENISKVMDIYRQ